MKKVGIVLEGGGARCFAHLGIMEELLKNKIPVDYIIGSSTGSLIASLLANKIDIQDIKSEFLKKSNRRKWRIPNGLFTFSQKAPRTILNNLLKNKKIEKSPIHLVLIGTNLNTGKEVLFEKGDIVKAACASCSHPLVHKPLKFKNEYISDGGILNNIPADVCRNKVGSNGTVISITLAGEIDHHIEKMNKFHLMFRTIYIPTLAFRKRNMEEYSDVILRPFKEYLFNFKNWKNIFDFSKEETLEKFYELGKKEAKLNMSSIKKAVFR